MKRIIRLTESDLTRIVRRVLSEQKIDLRITEFKVYNSPNGGEATVKSVNNPRSNRVYPKCSKRESSNCFDYPSTLQNGTYPPSSFSGDLNLFVDSKKYTCKLNSICKPD
jgi:hypothetical protein